MCANTKQTKYRKINVKFIQPNGKTISYTRLSKFKHPIPLIKKMAKKNYRQLTLDNALRTRNADDVLLLRKDKQKNIQFANQSGLFVIILYVVNWLENPKFFGSVSLFLELLEKSEFSFDVDRIVHYLCHFEPLKEYCAKLFSSVFSNRAIEGSDEFSFVSQEIQDYIFKMPHLDILPMNMKDSLFLYKLKHKYEKNFDIYQNYILAVEFDDKTVIFDSDYDELVGTLLQLRPERFNTFFNTALEVSAVEKLKRCFECNGLYGEEHIITILNSSLKSDEKYFILSGIEGSSVSLEKAINLCTAQNEIRIRNSLFSKNLNSGTSSFLIRNTEYLESLVEFEPNSQAILQQLYKTYVHVNIPVAQKILKYMDPLEKSKLIDITLDSCNLELLEVLLGKNYSRLHVELKNKERSEKKRECLGRYFRRLAVNFSLQDTSDRLLESVLKSTAEYTIEFFSSIL